MNTEEDDFTPEPYDAAELEYLAGSEQGFLTPYDPTTSVESLARQGPPILSSRRGVGESLVYKLQVATKLIGAHYEIGSEHFARVERGNGTMFETEEQRVITQAWMHQRGKELAEKAGKPYDPSKSDLGTLSKEDQERILKEWVAGQYVGPKLAAAGDILGQVEAYTRRNETYLPEDTRRIQAKLKTLLPATSLRAVDKAGKPPTPL